MALRDKLRGMVGSRWKTTDLFDEFAQGKWPRGGIQRYVCHGLTSDMLDGFEDQIEKPDDWDTAFGEGARRFRAWGDKAAAENDTVLAQRYFLVSAAYGFHGQLVPLMDARRRAELQHMCRVAYRHAAPLLTPKAEFLDLPFRDGDLHAYVRAAEKAAATCVIFPGQASCKEDAHYFTVPLLEYGLNTVAIDFPGTGEALPQLPYTGTDGMWGSIRAAIEAIPGASGRPLVFLALGAGCAQAIRLAAAEPKRVVGLALVCPPYDLQSVTERIRPWAAQELEMFLGCKPEALPQQLRYVSCVGAARKIQAPTLIIGGEVDRDFPRHQSKLLAKEFGDRADVWMFRGGSHGCYERFPKLRTRICQWLAHRVGATATHGRAGFED